MIFCSEAHREDKGKWRKVNLEFNAVYEEEGNDYELEKLGAIVNVMVIL